MKRALWMGLIMLMPGLLFAGGINIQIGGSSCAPVSCASYPVFFPPYSYYGYVSYPYYYSGPALGYSYVSSSSTGVGRTIRLGEEHDAFWDKHGGFEPVSFNTVGTQPLIEIAPIDRHSPLGVGDAESRIQDLDLDVSRIVASGSTTVYDLSDGRKVTAEQGIVLEISQR